MNASTFTARVITSTGADVAAAFSGAIGAMSGPLHGGAPSRVLGMIEEVEKRDGDATTYVKELLDSGERLMGFGHRVYRAEDPRARVLRRTAKELDAPRYEVAEALEKAALAELRERRPDRVLETNVEFWAAIVLDFAEVPAHMFTSMFTCARTGGWSAHILEQKTTGRLIRPSAVYAGPSTRPATEVEGWDEAWGLALAGLRNRAGGGPAGQAGPVGRHPVVGAAGDRVDERGRHEPADDAPRQRAGAQDRGEGAVAVVDAAVGVDVGHLDERPLRVDPQRRRGRRPGSWRRRCRRRAAGRGRPYACRSRSHRR